MQNDCTAVTAPCSHAKATRARTCDYISVSLEWEGLPFRPQRIFTINGVPPGTVRGCHGHQTCAQLLVAIAGEIEVRVVQDGEHRTIVLTPDSPGLLVPAGIWFSQTYVSADAVLLVLASEPYNPDATFDDPGAA